MGAMKELYLTMLDKLTEAGLVARSDAGTPTDKQLCDIAAAAITMEQFEAIASADQLDPLTLAEMKDAYLRGRYLNSVQFMEQVAEQLHRRGVAAVVDDANGGPTVHAGERSQWPNSNSVRSRAVLLGVGAHYSDEELARYEPDWDVPSRLGFASLDDERDGEYVGDRVTPEQVAERMALLVQRVEAQRHRLEMAVEVAADALWGGVVEAYPEVRSGDFGPGETFEMERSIRDGMKLWLLYNRPAEGIAPTQAEAAEIVAARRKAAVERVTPMVDLVHDREPDLLADLLHETLQDDAGRRTAGYDESVHADWLVWTAIYERASTLHEQSSTAGPADVAELLVDLLGEYHAVKALIAAAPGQLCDGRLPGGDLCGAILDDNRGRDGKCGPCTNEQER